MKILPEESEVLGVTIVSAEAEYKTMKSISMALIDLPLLPGPQLEIWPKELELDFVVNIIRASFYI